MSKILVDTMHIKNDVVLRVRDNFDCYFVHGSDKLNIVVDVLRNYATGYQINVRVNGNLLTSYPNVNEYKLEKKVSKNSV